MNLLVGIHKYVRRRGTHILDYILCSFMVVREGEAFSLNFPCNKSTNRSCIQSEPCGTLHSIPLTIFVNNVKANKNRKLNTIKTLIVETSRDKSGCNTDRDSDGISSYSFCSVEFIKYGSLPKNYNGMKVYGKKVL